MPVRNGSSTFWRRNKEFVAIAKVEELGGLVVEDGRDGLFSAPLTTQKVNEHVLAIGG